MSDELQAATLQALARTAISAPLVTHLYTADPSAHVFDGALYIYPSHDIDAGVAFSDDGSHFGMEDYHVFRMAHPQAPVEDLGQVLHVRDVPWAQRQMWAPDAAQRNGKTYLYFPAKRADGIFQIGVAVGDGPQGPFTAEPEPITGTYSIDPAVFGDADGEHYLYFGGIWGGQLQHYRDNVYAQTHQEPEGAAPALGPRVGRLHEDMRQLAEPTREVQILDEHGAPLRADDRARRFFEGPWVHHHAGRYYLSYSTGDTHRICYATSDSPYGPFVYQDVLLAPVIGWTTHHSICEVDDQWYLFYHDAELSGGQTHLRNIKMAPLQHDADGRIATIYPYGEQAVSPW